MYDPKKHHHHSVRLPHYDYHEAGVYFVTICTAQKRPVFGRLENGIVRLHPYGKIVEEELFRTAELRPEVQLDEYIIMPDHFHAIVIINPVGAHGNAPLRAPHSLSSLISGFKGSITRSINAQRALRDLSPVVVWQRSFYERIIRDEKELNETRLYIIENPLRRTP